MPVRTVEAMNTSEADIGAVDAPSRRLKSRWRRADDLGVDTNDSSRTEDRGVSLVEIIVAIALIGTIVVATVNAIFTSISVSSRTFIAAEVETVLINASDRVNRAPQLCDYEVYVDAAALAEGWDSSLVSSTTERLVANTGDTSADWETQPCPADVAPFDVQRVTITLTDPDNKVTKTLTVVKSDVS